jgi:uncharacterized protein involved in exopolysaccharide biosynthesis
MDLRELGSALRHGAFWIAGGAALGVLLAVLLAMVLPPSYTGRATILLRGGSSPALAGLAAGSRSDGGLGGLASVLGGASPFDTESEIIESRAVVAPVVDSLGLQLRLVAPRGTPARAVFSRMELPAELREGRYRLRLNGDRYEVEGPAGTTSAAPGEAVRVGGSTLALRPGTLPREIEVELMDREVAIEDAIKRLRVLRANGDVVEVVYRAGDSLTAAAVPNAIVERYMGRRKTVDRGVNQTRYEFLAQQTDSIGTALRTAEADYRQAQETTGVLDPELQGQSSMQLTGKLRGELDAMQAEVLALRRLAAGERVAPREIAAFPTLLRNAAITGTLERLQQLETQRSSLLERRTENDPEVVALSQSIAQVEGTLSGLARNYLAGLTAQEREVRARMDEHVAGLAALPGQAQSLVRLRREVERLGQTYVALQTQLVQVRLAAIGEGGELRTLDPALPPRRPTWPNLPLSVAAGLIGGLFFGAAGAVGAGRLRRQVHSAWEAELATGAPAVMLEDAAPVLLSAPEGGRSVLVLPVGRGANAREVARRVAATASLQGKPVAVAELERGGDAPVPALALLPAPEGATALAGSVPAERGGVLVYRADGNSASSLRDTLAELEPRDALVVGALRELSHPSTVAVLHPSRPVVIAAVAGQVQAAELEAAAGTLARLGVPLLGVALEPRARRGVRSAGAN